MLEGEALMAADDILQNNEKMELVKVCGPTEAAMVAEMLRNNGIDCMLQGTASANALPATSDLDEVRIWVDPKDTSRAAALVDAFFTPVTKEELADASTGLGTEDPEDKGGFTV